ncbi:polyhomeotic-like protein 3 isoform 1-T1 [Aulostomus maculatus]
MDREPGRQSHPEHGEATNGTSPQPSTSAPDSSPLATPTPPRLTPNPMLLDSPAPTLTPTTSSPPPPLTPAPSLSSTHSPKVVTAAAGTSSPHILVPAPPKLTSVSSPAPRTYSRQILPSGTGVSKTSNSSSLLLPSSSSPAVTTTTTSPLLSSSSTPTMSTKTSTTLTNGNTRPVSTPTSTPITPFHTPASPPGRQLQSLTLRPPPPGTLTIPPSLRLKPPSSNPPPLSRPHAPLFPPLRPRPQPSTTATESLTTPSRHLAVPPPSRCKRVEELAALYSPVRAVPLRPRLHSPRAAPSKHSSPLQPIAAAPACQAPPISRPLAGLKSCPLPQTLLGSNQPQHSSLPLAMSTASHFESSPSASRQLQIIALSSGRQPPPGTFTHNSVVGSSELSGQSKRTVSSDDVLPLNSLLPKTTSPLPSPPSLLSPASPPPETRPQTQTLVPKGSDVKESEGQLEAGQGLRRGVGDEGSAGQDLRVEKDYQRDRGKEDRLRTVVEKEAGLAGQTEQEGEASREEEKMEVTEEVERGSSEGDVEKKMEEEEEGDTAMDQSENPTGPALNKHQNTDSDLVKDSSTEPKPLLGLVAPPVQVQKPVLVPMQKPVLVPVQNPVVVPVQSQPPVQIQTPAPVPVQNPAPVPVQNPAPVPEVNVQSQRLPELPRDLQPVSQDDFCESMSTQSDNQSALSSLSSQSPPSSPFIVPSADNPPPLLPAQTAHPADLSLSTHMTKNVEVSGGESQHQAEMDSELLGQSEDELEGPWEPRVWPEGRQVLTHLVEGFVIQEGLQPFPVNRSSLLVPEHVTKPQEVNGTNGKAGLPAPDTEKPAEHSTDSDEEGGDIDEPGTRSGHRDRTVLHCQFCGKRGHAHNFMRSKRFCSTSCARGFNVRLTKRLRALSAGSRAERPRPTLNRAESVPGKPLLLRLPRDLWSAGRREKEGKEKVMATEEEEEEEEEEDEDEDMDGGGEEEDDDRGEEDPAVAMTARMDRRATRIMRTVSAPAVTTSTPTSTFKPAPSQWSVEEVTAFIHTLPGCSDVAEAFRLQEIDGQALLLLTEDHLMTSMNIKLGPALKICAHINALKNQ